MALLDAADIQHDPTGHVQWGEKLVVGDFDYGGFATGPLGLA